MKSLDSMNIGIVGVNTGNIQDYQSAIKGLSAEQAVFALKTKGANAAQIEEIMTTQTATLAKDAYTQADIQAALAKNGLSTSATILTTAQQKEIVQSGLITSEKLAEVAATLGLSTAEDGSLITKKALNVEMVKQQLTSMGVVGAAQQQILVMLGLVSAEGGAVAGTNVLTASFAKLWAVISAHPIGAIITAVGALAVGITAAVNASNKAKEEARQTAIELTNTYTQEKESLDSQIDKYKELKETLDSGNLSTNETRSIKEQLLEIQQSLIESYGNEASNIDLVNGKYREQLGLLSSLSKEKATEYVTENRDVFSDAKEALEKVRTYNLGRITSWSSYIPKTEEQQALLDFIDSYSELFEINASGSASHGAETFDVRNLQIKATVEDADDIMHQFAVDLENFGKENDIDVSGLLESISKQLKNTWTDELTEYKTVYDEFMKAEIVRNDTLRPLYQESIQAVEEYNNALSTGEGVEEAKANLESVQQSVQNATGELEGSQDVFDGIYEGINKDAEAAYNLDQSFKNDKSVQDYAEQLRGLSDVDLKAINFDNDNTENGEEAFRGLMETLGLTEDQVQNLIDKLVELGYVQGEVQGSTFDNETADLRLKMISKLNNLSEGFEELDKIYASILDKDAFDFKLLDDDNFKETFSTLDSYADFIETITSNPDDINACKDAFSTLVTEWITSTKILDNVTEDNEKLTAAMLKQMGVANADEVAHYALEKAKAEEHLQSEDCIDVTQASTEELLNEANAAGIDSNAFLEMVANEILFNRTDMKTEQKCQKILAIAQAAGVATTAMTTLQSQINEWANEEIGSGTRTKTAQDIGLTVKGKNDRTAEEWEKHGNLYIATDGTSFEGYEDAMYYQESLNNINKMTSAYNTLKYTGGSTSQDKEKALENSKETFDWIERAVKKVQRVITNLGKTVSATYKTWTTRNSALAQEIAEVNNELSLQQQAYNQYMAQAEAVGLSSYYKNQIQNGSLSIDSESDDTIKKQIKEYQDFYDKALSAADAVQDLQDQLAEFGKTKFQNKLAEYENELDEIEDYKKSLESIKSLLETQGYVASHNLYTSLAELEKENIENLKEEYEALTNSLNYAMENGVEKYSDDWYEMCSQIQDVNEQIISANTNLADLINQLRELDWELFDTKQNRISQITSESDWLIDLMSNKDLYDEDTGAITEQGKATLGLHAINYNTYMSQAEDYAEELLKINEQIANDPYNTTLLEHREELLESQRDMISAAEDEKQALFDLISEGYDSYLNALQEIIDKRKEAMDQIKDLYDYEKNISELNKDITILEKQEMAFRGNDSEEGMAKWQEIQASLEEARENLEETEYERYIDDQQKMLDTLYEDAEQWVNERLDNQDLLLQTVIDEANNNADSIKETLEKEVRDVGSVLSDNMMNILSPDSNVGQIVSMYGDNFNTYANTTVNTLLGIKAGVDAMLADSGLQVNTNIEALKLSNPYSTSGSGSSSATESSSTSSSTNSDSSSNGGWGSWFIAKKNSLSKSKLHIDTSIVDRLKYFDFDSSESARAKYYKSMGGSGEYYGTAKQNRWMLEQMKANGFKQGGTIGGIIKGTGEDGFILARTGEEVLSLEKIEALKDTLSMVNPLADTMAKLKIDLPDIQPRNNVVNQEFNMNFELHDVTNGEQLLDFVKNDKRFIKTIQQETIGAMMGQNSLGRYKY